MTTYEFPESELEAAIKKVFVDKEASSIEIDGHTMRNEFLRESLKYGLDKKLLKMDGESNEDGLLGKGVGQWTSQTYVLTAKGKKYFKIKSK